MPTGRNTPRRKAASAAAAKPSGTPKRSRTPKRSKTPKRRTRKNKSKPRPPDGNKQRALARTMVNQIAQVCNEAWTSKFTDCFAPWLQALIKVKYPNMMSNDRRAARCIALRYLEAKEYKMMKQNKMPTSAADRKKCASTLQSAVRQLIRRAIVKGLRMPLNHGVDETDVSDVKMHIIKKFLSDTETTLVRNKNGHYVSKKMSISASKRMKNALHCTYAEAAANLKDSKSKAMNDFKEMLKGMKPSLHMIIGKSNRRFLTKKFLDSLEK